MNGAAITKSRQTSYYTDVSVCVLLTASMPMRKAISGTLKNLDLRWLSLSFRRIAKKGTDNFFKSVKIKPTVDFDEIEEVMVVTNNMEEVKDLLDEEQVREKAKPHRSAR